MCKQRNPEILYATEVLDVQINVNQCNCAWDNDLTVQNVLILCLELLIIPQHISTLKWT